jgi:DNA helicase-2/ATP-dependent DNA helicase PcrA
VPDILKDLNPEQLEAVTYQGSPLLLLAGAGSGKTRVLTHRAAYFINQKIASPNQILLLTFTNKAAGEMKNRLEKLVSTIYDLKSNNFFAGTFHSFCCRVLRIDGDKIGINNNFAIYDSDDQENLIKRVLIDLDLNPKEFKPSSIAYFIENCKNNYQNPRQAIEEAHGFWGEYAAKIYSQYQKRLDEFNALDFNDLLFKVVDLFIKHPVILEKYQDKYKFILVDEYQDTNQIQYLLTKLLAKKYRQITAVGDASQAIYGWRGADYKNLVSFSSDFKDAKIINLERNYRSTQTILDAANNVISKNSTHPVLKLFTIKKSNDLIKIYEARNEMDEAEYIAKRIGFYYNDVHIPYKNIAVLYRMNAQSRVLEETFLKFSIPYVLLGGIRFYERSEVKDVLSFIRYLVNQNDKISETRTIKCLGKIKSRHLFEFIKTFNYKKLNTTQILESLINASNYLSRFDPKDDDDQKRIENIKELKSVATSFPKINDFLENIALVQQEYSAQEKSKKKDSRDGVRLMTLHGSKGLEFEVVFLVGFEEGLLPHSRCFIDEAQIEEERRLCYVGITRAKDFLEITYASKRLYIGKSSLNEPSRFLLDIPSCLQEVSTNKPFSKNKDKSEDDFIYDPDIY